MKVFQRFRLWVKHAASQDEVARRLEKVEHALETIAVQEPMSRVNDKNADALAKVTSALQHIDNYVVLVGSLIIIKSTDAAGRPTACARTLSVAEVRSFEQDERLLKSPADALKHLELLSSLGQSDASSATEYPADG
ncbi:hypothetical protein [Flindersiella endophytica]